MIGLFLSLLPLLPLTEEEEEEEEEGRELSKERGRISCTDLRGHTPSGCRLVSFRGAELFVTAVMETPSLMELQETFLKLGRDKRSNSFRHTHTHTHTHRK